MDQAKKKMMSRGAVLLGAAGLFLYIVGVKRRHRLDDERVIGELPRPRKGDGRARDMDTAADD